VTLLAAFLIGIVAGSRSMLAPAAVAWAARVGWIGLAPTWAGFMASLWAVLLFTALALLELVADKLPAIRSRKLPAPFGGRIVSGAFCGAALGAAAGSTVPAIALGAAGAVAGTLAGAELRGRMAAAFGADWPAALAEDAGAIVLGLLAVGP
jgi:uncharacterized membrane protein